MHGLTFESHYALVALTAMARHNSTSVLQMRQISAREHLPAPFLSKILLKLRHAGIVTSRHGRGGGYSLARSPFEITVREVLMACNDSPVAFDLHNPAIASNMPLSSGLQRLNGRLEKALEETTIGELAGIAAAGRETSVAYAAV